MNLDRAVLALAGSMILISVALTALVSPWWLLLTGFVGINLLQSSVTGFCPAALIFSRLGLSPGCAFTPEPSATTRQPQPEARTGSGGGRLGG